MPLVRGLCLLLLIAALPAVAYVAAMSMPQVQACFRACRDAEAVVNKSRADFVIHNSVDVRDQPQFVEVLYQWREYFKDLEKRVIEESDAACSPLHVNEAMTVILASLLLAAVFPGGGLVVSTWLQIASSAAAVIAMLMRQQHSMNSAFALIINDLRDTMSLKILPLTNQDDHYLYSLIYASTALRKSEETRHVMRAALQLPGLDFTYELSPAHAGVCCAVLATLALWLAATRCIDRQNLAALGSKDKSV
jgi:hypothetical protein